MINNFIIWSRTFRMYPETLYLGVYIFDRVV